MRLGPRVRSGSRVIQCNGGLRSGRDGGAWVERRAQGASGGSRQSGCDKTGGLRRRSPRLPELPLLHAGHHASAALAASHFASAALTRMGCSWAMLPRPCDAAVAALCERGVARRSNGRWGLSHVLHAMKNESFDEMRLLPRFSGRKLGAAVTTMAWDALRERMEGPPAIGRRDEVPTWVKAERVNDNETPGLVI